MSEKADVKTSRMQKGRKTINYLQKLKDEGTPIVQMCPGPRDQFWTMAAEMADVDICRLTVPGDGSDPEMQIKLAPYWISASATRRRSSTSTSTCKPRPTLPRKRLLPTALCT